MTHGLWRVTVDYLKGEEGFEWDYTSEKGQLVLIRESPEPDLTIKQSNSTLTGNATCFIQSDCTGLEIKIVLAGADKLPDLTDRYERITYTNDKGQFNFTGVPHRFPLNVHIEKSNYCWKRHMQTVTVNRTQSQPHI